jgi:hypothetical protein
MVYEGRETGQKGRYIMKAEEGNMRNRDERHKQVCKKIDSDRDGRGGEQGIGGCGTMERLDGGREIVR